MPVFYAIKSIKKDRISAAFYEEFRNETEILRTLVREEAYNEC